MLSKIVTDYICNTDWKPAIVTFSKAQPFQDDNFEAKETFRRLFKFALVGKQMYILKII